MAIALNWWGISCSNMYRRRIDFWKQMNQLCESFQNEIQFTADSPQKIINRLSKAEVFNNWQWEDRSQPFAEAFCRQTQLVMVPLGLASEADDVQAFGIGLGTTDLQGQLNHCQLYARLFAQKAELAQEEYASKGRLARSLCGLLSIAVVIMLI